MSDKNYYIIRIPKNEFGYLDNLKISKLAFVKQACYLFIDFLKEKGIENMYFKNTEILPQKILSNTIYTNLNNNTSNSQNNILNNEITAVDNSVSIKNKTTNTLKSNDEEGTIDPDLEKRTF